MEENEVSLLQQKINKSAEHRLEKELETAFQGLNRFICSESYHVKLSGVVGDIAVTGERKPATIITPTNVAFHEISIQLKKALLPKYIKEDTAAFLERIEIVRQVMEGQP